MLMHWQVLALIPEIPTAVPKPQFSFAAKTNVAVYYGQGPYQKDLIYFCQHPDIDLVILSFVHLFPQQANGLPGTTFGNQCRGAACPGPGSNPVKNALQADCPRLGPQSAACQATYDKKVLLSLGVGVSGYQLTGSGAGASFADQLWAMFGPQDAAQVAKGVSGPLDGPGRVVQLDGFDLDIKFPPTDGGAGYVALVRRLRAHMDAAAGRPQTPTPTPTRNLMVSPQCVVPDANMAAVIRFVRLDALFIQFYDTPWCSAAAYARANPPNGVGFTFDNWTAWLKGTPNASARLFVGLPSSSAAAAPGQFVAPDSASQLIDAFYCQPQFASVAI